MNKLTLAAAAASVATAAISVTTLVVTTSGDSEAWRDNCTDIQWDKQDSNDYFTKNAWHCKLDNGRWTTVYEFDPGTDVDALIELGESFDTKIEVVDRSGNDWVIFYDPDEQAGPPEPKSNPAVKQKIASDPCAVKPTPSDCME